METHGAQEALPSSAAKVPGTWRALCAELLATPGVVLVLGGPDSGKTTWVTAAARLLAPHTSVIVVDTDIGQASIGPPACVSATRVPPAGWNARQTRPDRVAFVGSVTPTGHALQLLTASHRLVRWARTEASIVLVDTTGLVASGFGFQVKLRKVELLEPRHIVVFERDEELEALRAVLTGWPTLSLHRLTVDPRTRRRTPAERGTWRAARFARYFRQACAQVLDLQTLLVLAPVVRLRTHPALPDVLRAEDLRHLEFRGLLIGLQDARGETLGLGIGDRLVEDSHLLLETPLVDTRAVRRLQLSWLRLDGLVTARSPAESDADAAPGR